MRQSFKNALVCSMLAAGVAAHATEYANVLSSTPILAAVAVPQQVCSDEQRVVQQRPTGAGALLGAIAGGVLGNSVGSGAGRAAATGLGLMAGSVIGDRVEANGTPAVEVPVRRCQTVSSYQQRTVGYNVVYDYAGQRYTTRMPNDPGQRLAVNVQPASDPISQPVPLVVAPPPAVVYAPQAEYYPVPAVGAAVYVNPTVIYGYGYHGHRYWR